MYNLFAFIQKYAFFFLFILLMVLSLILMVQNNYYQRTVVINTTNNLTGGLQATMNNVTGYFNLREANRQLAEENARLRQMLPPAHDSVPEYESEQLHDRQYSFIPARVISNSVNRRNNFIKLNKGRRDGVGMNMAVLAPNGVVGQVVEVSERFSSVMSLINSQSRINAKLKSSGQVGSVLWDGRSYRMATLIDIPSHVHLFIGDSVVTSGFSHIYPEGQLIGIVEDFGIDPGENFFVVDIRLAVDFNKLAYVYVVHNRYLEELLEFEGGLPNN